MTIAANGVIWDLDNTLYRLDEALYTAFDHAFARAVIAAGVDLEFSEAAALARESYREHGFSGETFIRQYGLSRAQLHYDYHGMVDEKIITACLDTVALFEALPQKHVLLTHGSRDWAQRVLTHLGLSSFFTDILALEDYAFEQKHESARPFLAALDKLGTPREKTLMVEDTTRNLRIPHGLGLQTALIHHGQPPVSLPAYVGHSFNNAIELLKNLRISAKAD